MRDEWLKFCEDLAFSNAPHFYSGARKILPGVTWKLAAFDDSLHLADIGYTKYKLKQLERNYLERESWAAAQALWEKRLGQRKYGSVGFSCFAHLVKGRSAGGELNIEGTSKRASVMGPCMQSVTLTLLKKDACKVDVFYRTTEVLKKFPADLIFLRDVLLKPFEGDFQEVNFHFANLTLHPMYWVTIIPMMRKPIKTLKLLKDRDPHFHNWVVKWSARYLCPGFGRGIEKFSQALRVRQSALGLIQNPAKLQEYLRKNHPGIRG